MKTSEIIFSHIIISLYGYLKDFLPSVFFSEYGYLTVSEDYYLLRYLFVHLEKLSVNFSRPSFVILVNLLHRNPSLFLYSLLSSVLCFFYLSRLLFSGFLQIIVDFLRCQNAVV